ncbi:hypothetical protein FOL47_000072 [Perkinsus chesapeaki]|uniref:WW domain-containing protein n=1 Tax=Perkinsus chesapeaki TaxID=330153 RepID=A0A7J6N391_PERCH|nr:hypothetical protein FOL47_000072 [Perkinsus chesapeaki]
MNRFAPPSDAISSLLCRDKMGLFGKKRLSSKTSEAVTQNTKAQVDTTAEGARRSESSRASTTVNDFIARSKQNQKHGIKPSGPELVAYAKYLGVDPVADGDLLWLAEEAITAPLPGEWTEHFDQSDRVFYYNAESRFSTWTHPLENLYRETYKVITSIRSPSVSQEAKLQHIQAYQNDLVALDREETLTDWGEHADDSGCQFYSNRQTGKSTWTDPRTAVCHCFQLKSKVFKMLCSYAGLRYPPDDNREKVGSPLPPVGSARSSPRRVTPARGSEATIREKMVEETNLEVDVAAAGLDGNMDLAREEGTVKKKKKKKHKKHHRHHEDEGTPSPAPQSVSPGPPLPVRPGLGLPAASRGGSIISSTSVIRDGPLPDMGTNKIRTAGIRLEPLPRRPSDVT